MDAKCTVQQITQKKANQCQAKDAVVTIINVITNKDLKHLPKRSETEIIFLIKIGENRMIVEYIIAKECKNEKV